MNGRGSWTNFSAARLVASIFGALAGVGGLTHGIGEMLQGNIVPDSMFIDSWIQGPIATHMAGDPAMTVVPNLLITGVLGSVVSLVTIIWAVGFVQRKHGGVVLILLCIAMFLVGGGFGSPIVGILAGIAGILISAETPWWRRRLSGPVGRFLARAWPWLFGIAVLNGFFLFVGAIILVYAFGWGNEQLYLNSFFLAVVSVSFTVLAGIAYDLQSEKRVAVRSAEVRDG